MYDTMHRSAGGARAPPRPARPIRAIPVGVAHVLERQPAGQTPSEVGDERGRAY